MIPERVGRQQRLRERGLPGCQLAGDDEYGAVVRHRESGAGWNEEEFTSYRVPFDDRFARFEDALRIIAAMVRDGRSTHDGATIQTRSARLEVQLRPNALAGVQAFAPAIERMR